MSRRYPVERIKKAGDAVEDGTGARMDRHVVEGCYCKDDTSIAYWEAISNPLQYSVWSPEPPTNDVRNEEENVLGYVFLYSARAFGRLCRSVDMAIGFWPAAVLHFDLCCLPPRTHPR